MIKHIVNYIDLCSGIGGFRYGINKFQQEHPEYEFNCLLSADIKKDALATYNLNFGENNEKTDIYTIDENKLEPFDLLTAGFPCQPFSTAGQKKGFSDKRGGMIFKIIDICRKCRPKTVLLENVANLLTLDNGECIKKIQKLFEDIDYNVAYKKMNSSNFGCPQSRERVYIICTLDSKVDFENIREKPKKFIRDIIDNTDISTNLSSEFINKLLSLHKKNSINGCKIGDKRGGRNNIHSWTLGYNGTISQDECDLLNKLMLERRKKHWASKKNITWMDGMPLTFGEIKSFYSKETLQDMLNNLVKLNYLRLEKPKDLVDGKRVYKEDSEAGYNICKGKLSFPIGKILDPDGLSPTLTATDCDRLAIIVGETIRKLNKKELKGLCGFPDTMQIPDNVNVYDLFGNMATPPVITSILEIIYV